MLAGRPVCPESREAEPVTCIWSGKEAGAWKVSPISRPMVLPHSSSFLRLASLAPQTTWQNRAVLEDQVHP